MVTTFNKSDLLSFGRYLFSDRRRQLFIDRMEIGTNVPDLEDRIKEISNADFTNWKDGHDQPEKSIISDGHDYPQALSAIKNGYWAIRKHMYGRFVISRYNNTQSASSGSDRLIMTELDFAVHHEYIPSFSDQMAEDWIIMFSPKVFRNQSMDQQEKPMMIDVRLNQPINFVYQAGFDASSKLISGIDSVTGKENFKYINFPIKDYDVIIDYPLSSPVVLKLSENQQTIGELMYTISKFYKEIYENASKFDVSIWGHDLSDLVFESIIIKDRQINLIIGS